jgi:CheY-like chemotaxis protein
MDFILDLYRLLEQQVASLGQSPDNGVLLLKRLKDRYPGVPIVFYSRKITPEDVTRVQRAGAVDVIRKGAVPSDEVRQRLREALTKNQPK